MFTLSSFVKTTKKYALNPSISDEEYINMLLEPYVLASNAKGRNGADFYLDKHRTSRILSGSVDVPLALRKVDLQHGLENRMLEGCSVLFDETLDPELDNCLMEDVISLLTGDDVRVVSLRRKLEVRLEDRNSFLACAIIGAIGTNNKSNSESLLWKRGSATLCWRTGDLFRFGFGNRKKARNIIVIPVDCSFRTHVTREYEATPIKEVSENSLHGKWLARMAMSGVAECELSNRIKRELCATGARVKEPAGSYSVGTIAAIQTPNAIYLLLAVSEFDTMGVAKSTPEDIRTALRSLAGYIIANGQGADVYLPLIGTGLSKSGISCKQAYSLIVQTLSDNAHTLSCKTTIVIQEQDASDIGLIN